MSSSSTSSPSFVWCPYTIYNPDKTAAPTGDYSTVETGSVPAAFRASGPNDPMPPVPAHGGLYGGPVTNNPWNSIPVTPTATNLIQNNLRSANPPPGATEQYIGTPRLGNNYEPMPGVYWYNPDEAKGQYAIKATHACERRSYDINGVSIPRKPSVVDNLTNFYSNLLAQ